MAPPVYAWCSQGNKVSGAKGYTSIHYSFAYPTMDSQDRDIRVCVFPKCEESLIGRLRLGLISRKREHSTELASAAVRLGIRSPRYRDDRGFLKFGNRSA